MNREIGGNENEHRFCLTGAELNTRASGALWWPRRRVLVVSDLHLGKSERIARLGGALLPPYETDDTLFRLEAEIRAKQPRTVICLGDSFDDLTATDGLNRNALALLNSLIATHEWIWIEGNHDPGPPFSTCSHMTQLSIEPLTFRHIAASGSNGEVSGHYHPKATVNARGRSLTRPCFLYNRNRVILPAFGTYTGGLRHTAPQLAELMGTGTIAVLTGPKARVVSL